MLADLAIKAVYGGVVAFHWLAGRGIFVRGYRVRSRVAKRGCDPPGCRPWGEKGIPYLGRITMT